MLWRTLYASVFSLILLSITLPSAMHCALKRRQILSIHVTSNLNHIPKRVIELRLLSLRISPNHFVQLGRVNLKCSL